MNNTVQSARGKTVQEIHDDDIAEDDYNQLTVQDLVIERCIVKGVITSNDVTNKTKNFLALNEVIETAHYAFRLVDNFDDAKITTDNIAACNEYKKKLVQRIIEVISNKLLVSLPELRR